MVKELAKKEGVFLYLFFLTGFFLLLEISFFIQCNGAYLEDFTFVSHQLHIPLTIVPGILFFIFAQLLVHLSFCVMVWALTILIADLIANYFPVSKITVGVGIWLLAMLTVLTANTYFYPNSKFSELMSLVLFNQWVTVIVLILLLIPCVGCILLALNIIFKKIISKKILNKYIAVTAGIGLISVLIGFAWLKATPVVITDAASVSKPNIIIVGVDSLRPDFLEYFGGQENTPFFDSFLKEATIFNEAVTPLARTFPSWSSLLAGAYPRQIGVRSNLSKQDHIRMQVMLPAILKQQGYTTAFATDETRFSNIDANFGFDHVISPPMGLNDFLIGTFNDFPLSNLLVNTRLGRWLFPYSYANRPVYITYEPNSFLNLVKPLLQTPRTKPLFLAIHFCVTHHPYTWAGLQARGMTIQERYMASIVRVDEQLQDFFVLLKQSHLLDHAIVVLLSDHGETLEWPGDRLTEKELFVNHKAKIAPKFYPPSLDEEQINQSAGHGTDVLGLPQYHTLLAFRLYGVGPQQVATVPQVVSLLSIKPTLLQMIGIKSFFQRRYMGDSLADIISNKAKPSLPVHDFFLESDYAPAAIRTVYPKTRDVLLEGIHLFQIDPHTLRLTVKDSMATMIIRSKQYADIYDHWMLALYPQNDQYRMPILINLENGEWTNDLHSSFAAKSPASHMLSALRAFYGNEIGKVE